MRSLNYGFFDCLQSSFLSQSLVKNQKIVMICFFPAVTCEAIEWKRDLIQGTLTRAVYSQKPLPNVSFPVGTTVRMECLVFIPEHDNASLITNFEEGVCLKTGVWSNTYVHCVKGEYLESLTILQKNCLIFVNCFFCW